MKYKTEKESIVIETEGSYIGKTIGRFMEDMCISKAEKYLLLQEKRLLKNGTPVKAKEEVIRKNDVLTIYYKPEKPDDIVISDKPAEIIYENDFVMIVHKDAGCIIHDSNDPSCLNAQVAKYIHDKGYDIPIRPIHRLDKETSGLVLYVKIPFFLPWFDNQLSTRRISRRYLAVTEGRPLEIGKEFIFDERLGKDRHINGKYRVSSTGKSARTKVTCLARKGRYQLLECELETGRTHQIRVHLSYHNLPIVNDDLYGYYSMDFEKMGLWAYCLTFRDPITGKRHRIYDKDNPDYTHFENAYKHANTTA